MTEIDKEITLKGIVVMALPLMISQGTETIMMFTDRIFLSHLGKEYLTASMSGGLSSYVFSSVFIGVIGYVTALVAQFHGAKQKMNGYKAVGQAVWLSFLFYPLALGLIPLVRGFFLWAGHTGTQVELEFTYFRVLMFGILITFIRNALAGHFIGTSQTGVVMRANLLGMVVNIPLNWVLIFGKLGFPAMGLTGAALGTIGGSVVATLFLLFLYAKNCRKEQIPLFCKWEWGIMKKLLRFGGPAGGELFFNVFLFNFFLQLFHSYSPDVASAATITFSYDMVAFVPLLGLGMAITSLVGQQMGGDSVAGAKKVTALTSRLAYIYGGVLVLVFLGMTPSLVELFAGNFSAADGAVRPLAITMLRLAAIYILADATQLLFAGALRGAGDTRWVMFISMSLHLVMGVASFIMVRVLKTPPLYVWYMFIGFVLVLGLAMFFRYLSGEWQKIRMIEKAGQEEMLDSLRSQSS